MSIQYFILSRSINDCHFTKTNVHSNLSYDVIFHYRVTAFYNVKIIVIDCFPTSFVWIYSVRNANNYCNYCTMKINNYFKISHWSIASSRLNKVCRLVETYMHKRREMMTERETIFQVMRYHSLKFINNIPDETQYTTCIFPGLNTPGTDTYYVMWHQSSPLLHNNNETVTTRENIHHSLDRLSHEKFWIYEMRAEVVYYFLLKIIIFYKSCVSFFFRMLR